MVPSVVSTPARYSSATASTIPEPQTPVTWTRRTRPRPTRRRSRSRATAARASRGRCERARRHPAPRADRTRSARPRRRGRWARRCEQSVAVAEHDLRVRADVDDEADSSPRYGASDSSTPAVSAPTWPAMQGRTYARAPGGRGSRRRAPAGEPPRRPRARTAPAPSGVGSIPSRRWCMIGLPTSVTSRTSRRSISAARASSAVSFARQPRTALVSSCSEPGLSIT